MTVPTLMMIGSHTYVMRSYTHDRAHTTRICGESDKEGEGECLVVCVW